MKNLTRLILSIFVFCGLIIYFSRLPLVLLIPPTLTLSILIQQFLAGNIHEAAHYNFYPESKKVNDFFANYFACYFFLYDISSYRQTHNQHHKRKVFLTKNDEETSVNATRIKNAISSFIFELSGFTAIKLILFRNSFSSNTRQKSFMKKVEILSFNILFWTSLHYFCSLPFISIFIFYACFALIYPSANRIRVWATHGDAIASEGLIDSGVFRNVHSPWYERIFFGNKMLMYHYEHHLNPSLSYLDCEKKALLRMVQEKDNPNFKNIFANSYVKIVYEILFKK
jgi:fatty acid desaturase